MRPLLYTINVTLDGCVDHREGIPSEGLHRHAAAMIERADAIIFGRVTYQMMEEAWRPPTPPDRPAWMAPFAATMDRAKKYVASRTLTQVDWNAELIRGDLGTAVQTLKEQPGNGLAVAGTKLALALTDLGLIDEYEIIVHPVFAGHGPTLFAGLSERLQLRLLGREVLDSGAVVLRYARSDDAKSA